MKMRKDVLLVVGLLVSIFLIYGSLSYAKEVRTKAGDTIKIGMIVDMTGPTATDIGMPVVAGLRTYFMDINDRGGIHGKKVNLLVEDDRYAIPYSIAAFKKLVFKDKVLALEGPVSSGSALALLNQINKNKIPNICYSPSERMLNPIQRYVFTGGGLYKDEIKILFEYIFKNEKMPTVALVYPDHEIGLAALRAAQEESKRRGVKLHTEVLNIGELDATSQVLNLKRSKINNVIIQGNPLLPVVLMRAATKLGFQAKYYGTTASTSEDIIELGGSAVKDFKGAHMFSSCYDSYPGSVKLREALIKYYGKIPAKNSRLLSVGWVCGMILKEALVRAVPDLTGDKVRDALEGIKNLDTGGLTGPISYGPEDHKGLDYSKIIKADLKNKVFISITDWIKPAE